MQLADFIASNKDQLIERWQELAVERLSLKLHESELINELPEFIDDVVDALRDPSEDWPVTEKAQAHGRARMRAGIDMGSLTEEMMLVIEVICEMEEADGTTVTYEELRRLSRVMGHGTAAAINAYTAMRDREIANQAIRHFSFIAHEIRNPLHSARLAAGLLASGDEKNREKNAMRLERALAQLSELVDNTLIQARLYQKPILNVQQVDVRELVEAACDDIRGHAEARGISVSREVEDFELDADRKLMLSALTNLMQNAIKFTQEGSCIAIRASQKEDRALFEIADKCGGMAEDVPSRLFQPFVQESADKSGFGLGLMIVKQAAEAHGGAVRIANRPGEGCSFILELPLHQGPSKEAGGDAASHAQGGE